VCKALCRRGRLIGKKLLVSGGSLSLPALRYLGVNLARRSDVCVAHQLLEQVGRRPVICMVLGMALAERADRRRCGQLDFRLLGVPLGRPKDLIDHVTGLPCPWVFATFPSEAGTASPPATLDDL